MRMDWNDPKHLLAAVVVVAVVLVGLYYVISPYQNCVRNGSGSTVHSNYCSVHSSW